MRRNRTLSRIGRALGRWAVAACLLALLLPAAAVHAPLHDHGHEVPAALADAAGGDHPCPVAAGSPHRPCGSCPLHLCCALPLDDIRPATAATAAILWPEPRSGTPRHVDPLLRPPRGAHAA